MTMTNGGHGKPPAFQFYVKEYLTDEAVVMMDVADEGAYLRLMCAHWMEGSIPADVGDLAKICRISRSRFLRTWKHLAQKFFPHPEKNGRLINQKLADQRAEYDAYVRAQSLAGKRGARRRWGNEGDTDEHGNPNGNPIGDPNGNPNGVGIAKGVADGWQANSSASATASVTKKNTGIKKIAGNETGTEKEKENPASAGQKKRKADPPKRGTQLPADWAPSEDHIRQAVAARVDVAVECERFRDWSTAKGAVYRDWDAAFRNWLRKAAEFIASKPPPGSEAARFKSERPGHGRTTTGGMVAIGTVQGNHTWNGQRWMPL